MRSFAAIPIAVHTDDFPGDVAEQGPLVCPAAGYALAFNYARAVEATLEFLARHPPLGSPCRYPEPQLADSRLYLVEKPFDRHLIYYRASGEELVAFCVVPGPRDLPQRPLDPPGRNDSNRNARCEVSGFTRRRTGSRQSRPSPRRSASPRKNGVAKPATWIRG